MYGIKEVGKYNVDFEGFVYDGKIPYEIVIIEKFDGNTPVEGSKKTLYFRQNIGTERKYIMPEFKNEKAVEMWLQYQNNTKIQMYNKIVVEEIR